VVQTEIVRLAIAQAEALVIPRFDRTPSGGRLHFEEFTQLLGSRSAQKYDGSYEAMGRFVGRFVPAEAYRLMSRVLACLLVGNTDAHYKNFAMFHTRAGLRLTPAYDLVAGSLYSQFQSIALALAGAESMKITDLKPKHLLLMGEGFGAEEETVVGAVEVLGRRLPNAQAAIEGSSVGSKQIRTRLIDKMEKRWKGSFESIGRLSSKRRNKNARR
jgi:serine/threonine-protein kinase HipA